LTFRREIYTDHLKGASIARHAVLFDSAAAPSVPLMTGHFLRCLFARASGTLALF
jgi:hypothetical protein